MKFLGIPDEVRLALEQNGTPVDAVAKLSQMYAEEAQREMEQKLREVQEVIGPHGSVTRLQAGGVKIERGTGIAVFEDGVLKSTIDPQGNLFVGSDITDPVNTSLCVFVNDQVYNNEDMSAGDLLIGDNSTGAPNIRYNATEGRFEFRLGQTVNIIMDTDGALTMSNNVTGLSFATTDALKSMYIKGTDADDLWIVNNVASRLIYLSAMMTNGNTRYIKWSEDPSNANIPRMEINASEENTRVTIGGTSNPGIQLWARKDGTETVFNESSHDIDFRVESADNTAALKVDAGLNRVEFGADHYIPNRNASNPNVYFNEANQDMDFIINGSTVDEVFKVDAGLDKAYYKGVELGGGGSDGWNAASDTWTRTANHTFTVSGDVTATYRKGAKVRYKDGGTYEYGVIVSSSHAAGTTTVNLLVNTDYAMASTTITDTYLSYIENPEGFPTSFNWSVSWTNLSVGNGTQVAKITKITPNEIEGYISLIFGSTSSISGDVSFNLPAATLMAFSGSLNLSIGLVQAVDASAGVGYAAIVRSDDGTTAKLRRQFISATNLRFAAFGATEPFTWTTSDTLTVPFRYAW